MSLLSKYMAGTLTILSENDLRATTMIVSNAFYSYKPITSVTLPDSIKVIGKYAFNDSGLTTVNSDSMDPRCIIRQSAFHITPFRTNIAPETSLLMAQGRILYRNTTSTPSAGLSIPGTVINIAGNAFEKSTDDPNFTSVVVPDSIEIMGDAIFSGHSSLTSITVGAAVQFIGSDLVPSTGITTLIFRQPKDLYVELPTAGEDDGMAYNKSSYSIDIYTDNDCIRNYDWATDNVTATFHPLSEAPT